MRPPRLLPPLVVMLAGLGCAAAPPQEPFEGAPGEPRSVDAMLDATTREIMRHPSAVTVYRLNHRYDNDADASVVQGHFQEYTFRQRATPKAEIAQRLADKLLDDQTYVFGRHKRCIFNPGVGVRFERGAGWVEILICYSCDEMAYTSSSGGKAWVSFDTGAEALRAITDQALAP